MAKKNYGKPKTRYVFCNNESQTAYFYFDINFFITKLRRSISNDVTEQTHPNKWIAKLDVNTYSVMYNKHCKIYNKFI